MIWHDFMFANTLYPDDKAFHDNALIEVTEAVKRVRNQASVVFWNGNNEILQGYREWGWAGRPKQLWEGYKKFF